MFNITDGNNNVSRDKPVEHIDMVIGLHVSACTSCTRTMRVRRDIAIDITESVQLLVRFNALRSMPVMPKLEHYNQNAMRSMAAAALATQAAAANARARPRLAGQCQKWLARPNTQRARPVLGRSTALALPPHAPAQLPAQTPARTPAQTGAQPHTWPGAFAQMSARFHPRYAGGLGGSRQLPSPRDGRWWAAALTGLAKAGVRVVLYRSR